jgi:C4-dicarboxylate-specific signal transduction histidine kinase
MMTRASASEISGGGKAGGGGGAAAGAWARPGCPDANNSSRPRIAIVCDDAGRRNFMRSSLCVQQIHAPRIRSQVPRCIDHAADQEAGLVRAISEWLLHPDDRAKTQVELTRPAEGRTTRHFESRYRNARDSYCWLSWRAATDKGHIYAVGRDITELKNAEEQLRTSRRELAKVSRQTTMGAMTASIAHEMNQPLGAIVANANAGMRWLTRAEPDLDEARASLGRIARDGLRASELIASIRSMFGNGKSPSIAAK